MFSEQNDTQRQIAVISGLTMVLIVNALANILPINGVTTGDLSDQYDVFFVPAGYVFSIWAVIYSFLIAYIVYQALPSQKTNQLHRRIAPWFLVSCVANAGWILAWHYQFVTVSLILMLVILGTLLAIYLTLGTGQYKVTRGEQVFMRVPFSLYFAWITVATVANFTTFLTFIDWSGLGISPMMWGIIMLVVATLIEAAMALRFRDAVYVGVIVWAFVGIAVKHADTLPIAATAGVMAAAVALALFVPTRRQRELALG